MCDKLRGGLIVVILFALCANRVSAQQITIDTSSVTIGDSFFDLGASQGASRNLSATAGSVTVMNGATGYFAAVTQRPFVTGLFPVLGDYGGNIAPVFGPAGLMAAPTSRTSMVRERINRLRDGERPPPVTSARGSAANARAATTIRNNVEAQDGFRTRLTSARSSSAGRSDLSVAEIRRRQADDIHQADKIETKRNGH